MAEINIISLNCHDFNAGTALYLQVIAHNADTILLQETWLCDATYFKLTDALRDFTVYHSSAMEDKFATGICTGRPFGGTAVLVHKKARQPHLPCSNG